MRVGLGAHGRLVRLEKTEMAPVDMRLPALSGELGPGSAAYMCHSAVERFDGNFRKSH